MICSAFDCFPIWFSRNGSMRRERLWRCYGSHTFRWDKKKTWKSDTLQSEIVPRVSPRYFCWAGPVGTTCIKQRELAGSHERCMHLDLVRRSPARVVAVSYWPERRSWCTAGSYRSLPGCPRWGGVSAGSSQRQPSASSLRYGIKNVSSRFRLFSTPYPYRLRVS